MWSSSITAPPARAVKASATKAGLQIEKILDANHTCDHFVTALWLYFDFKRNFMFLV